MIFNAVTYDLICVPIYGKEECIPVGCVPPAAVTISVGSPHPWEQTTPSGAGTPLGSRHPPWEQAPPLGADTPHGADPPGTGTPPGAGTPPRRRHLLGNRHTPVDRILKTRY